MPSYLLDTNIVSFLLRKSSSALLHRVRTTPASRLCLSSVVEAEVRLGLALMPAEAKLPATGERFLRSVTVHPWDSRCAEVYALTAARQQRVGKPLALADTMIAAHALAEGHILVTNDKAFSHVEGLRVEDWTKGLEPA